MKSELRLIDDDQGGELRLAQQGRQADEAQRSIRQRVSREQHVFGPVTPRKLDDIGIDGIRRQEEVVEERRDRPHGLDDTPVSPRGRGLERIQKRCEVVALGAQRPVVVDLALLLCRR